MGRHSIRWRITALLLGIFLLMLLMVVLTNSLLSERFYRDRKQKEMLRGYKEINEIMMDYANGTITQEQMQDKIDQKTESGALSTIVVSSDWTPLYVNTGSVNEMINRLRMSMFNRDLFHQEKMPDGIKKDGENTDDIRNGDGNLNPKESHDAKEFPKGGKDQIDMFGSGLADNREILREEDNYTLQKVYDERMLDDYYELWGMLDNGNFIMMRASVQGIRDSVKVFNTFIAYVGLLLLVIALLVTFAFTNVISKPIMDLSHLAERMADMDFDARYEGKDKGEIGVLGNSMNYMSSRLEENISQLKAANIELQKDIERKTQIEQMRSDFLSNVSHELKTPIALIQGYAEGLKEGISDDPESMEFYCDVIMDEANKMNSMVKKLLTLNQIEFGADEPVMERFDLMELLNAVVNANMLRAENQGCAIHLVSEERTLAVWADEYKVEEVLTNYLSNAINHCAGDKQIYVRTKRIGDDVRVTVFNTGKHIPEEDLEKIWEKFYKVDKARTREYGGNGIGLSIVKAIMESFGKQCGVNNVDGGVEFWFDLDAKA